MLLNVYLFSFALGAVLLLASIFMGGDDADAEMGADADLSVDVDADAGGDVAHHGDVGEIGGFFGALGSVRFWTFFTAAFGLMGSLVEWQQMVPSMTVGLPLSAGVGATAGYVAVEAFRRLAAGESGHVAGAQDYVGKSGRLLIAVSSANVGKVRVEVKGTTVDLLATIDGDEVLPKGSQALVIEMRGTTALVAPLKTSSET